MMTQAISINYFFIFLIKKIRELKENLTSGSCLLKLEQTTHVPDAINRDKRVTAVLKEMVSKKHEDDAASAVWSFLRSFRSEEPPPLTQDTNLISSLIIYRLKLKRLLADTDSALQLHLRRSLHMDDPDWSPQTLIEELTSLVQSIVPLPHRDAAAILSAAKLRSSLGAPNNYFSDNAMREDSTSAAAAAAAAAVAVLSKDPPGIVNLRSAHRSRTLPSEATRPNQLTAALAAAAAAILPSFTNDNTNNESLLRTMFRRQCSGTLQPPATGTSAVPARQQSLPQAVGGPSASPSLNTLTPAGSAEFASGITPPEWDTLFTTGSSDCCLTGGPSRGSLDWYVRRAEEPSFAAAAVAAQAVIHRHQDRRITRTSPASATSPYVLPVDELHQQHLLNNALFVDSVTSSTDEFAQMLQQLPLEPSTPKPNASNSGQSTTATQQLLLDSDCCIRSQMTPPSLQRSVTFAEDCEPKGRWRASDDSKSVDRSSLFVDELGFSSTTSEEKDGSSDNIIQSPNNNLLMYSTTTTTTANSLAAHHAGTCKPCAFYYSRRKTCVHGESCAFCHHTDHASVGIKQWKKIQQQKGTWQPSRIVAAARAATTAVNTTSPAANTTQWVSG